MDTFYPFIYNPKKKNNMEPQPLYIELIPTIEPIPNEKEEIPKIIIIELL